MDPVSLRAGHGEASVFHSTFRGKPWEVLKQEVWIRFRKVTVSLIHLSLTPF